MPSLCALLPCASTALPLSTQQPRHHGIVCQDEKSLIVRTRSAIDCILPIDRYRAHGCFPSTLEAIAAYM